MVNSPRNGQRGGAMSFDNKQFYGATPSTADIVCDATAARSGPYGLHATIQSGIASTVVLPVDFSGPVGYYRWYQTFKVIPSTARVFMSTAAVITNLLNLQINSNGTIALRRGTVTIATTSTAYVVNQELMIELGINQTDSLLALKVNGVLEADWTAAGGGITLAPTLMFGCSDTVASAMEYYIDDLVWDNLSWPGSGRVKMVKILDVVTDNANWTLTGSTKPSALDPGTTFDDTTFISCAVNNQAIVLGLDTMPTDAIVVYGISQWARGIRTGAASSIFGYRTGWRGSTVPQSSGLSSDPMSTGASFTVQTQGLTAYSSIFGGLFPPQYHNELTVGLTSLSANGQKISAYWVEVDYSDIAGEIPMERPIQLMSFEDSAIAEIAPTNRSTTGTVQVSTAWSKFDAQSLEIVHASGGQSRLTFPMNQIPGRLGTAKILKFSFWMYVQTFHSSGNCGIFAATTGRVSLNLTSAGALTITVDSVASSAVGAVTLQTETHISVEIQLGTASGANTVVKLWQDDVLLLTYSAANAITDMNTTSLFVFGTSANVAGGATVRYDGVAIDGAVRQDRSLRFATLVPTGAGTNTVAGFTASSGSKFQCVDEFPNNGDTDYVLLATGLGATSRETYALTDISGTAITVTQLIQVVMIHKRDAGTNGVVESATRMAATNVSRAITGDVTASGAAYAASVTFVQAQAAIGIITPAVINSLEAGEIQASNTVASRISSIQVGIAYRAANVYPLINRHRISWVG